MLVTHDVADAIVLADRIGVIREGRIIQVGTPAELAAAPVDDFVARVFG
jgi:multiple sugar transport system ATP-binding protein